MVMNHGGKMIIGMGYFWGYTKHIKCGYVRKLPKKTQNCNSMSNVMINHGFLFEVPYLQPTFRGTPGSAVVQCHLGPIWFNFGGSSHVVTGFHIYKPSISLGLSSKDPIWKTKPKHTKTIISYYFWCSIRDFTLSANTAWLVWKTREHWVEWYVQPSSSANRRPTAEISPTDMSSRKKQQYKFY